MDYEFSHLIENLIEFGGDTFETYLASEEVHGGLIWVTSSRDKRILRFPDEHSARMFAIGQGGISRERVSYPLFQLEVIDG